MDTNTNADTTAKNSGLIKKRLLGNLEIAAFCDQLAMVIGAGLPAYEGISILIDDAPDKDTKEILQSIYKPLETGCAFHEALRESGVFPKYVLDMEEIGEMSGNLDDILHSLHHYYEREESIKQGIKTAVTYPFVMIGIMIAILFVLITKVLPIFNQIYSELGSGLSGFALAMMNLSQGLNKYFAVIIAVLVLILVVFFIFSKTSLWKKYFQGKKFAMNTAASRFANCMALALSSGLDTTQGMDLALQLVDNNIMAERIRKCKAMMEEGVSFSNSIQEAGIFRNIYASMITIGYKTGELDQIMGKISEEYENDLDYQINHFISILEPALVIILSVMIGLILISFLFPLIGIMSSIG